MASVPTLDEALELVSPSIEDDAARKAKAQEIIDSATAYNNWRATNPASQDQPTTAKVNGEDVPVLSMPAGAVSIPEGHEATADVEYVGEDGEGDDAL